METDCGTAVARGTTKTCMPACLPTFLPLVVMKSAPLCGCGGGSGSATAAPHTATLYRWLHLDRAAIVELSGTCERTSASGRGAAERGGAGRDTAVRRGGPRRRVWGGRGVCRGGGGGSGTARGSTSPPARAREDGQGWRLYGRRTCFPFPTVLDRGWGRGPGLWGRGGSWTRRLWYGDEAASAAGVALEDLVRGVRVQYEASSRAGTLKVWEPLVLDETIDELRGRRG